MSALRQTSRPQLSGRDAVQAFSDAAFAAFELATGRVTEHRLTLNIAGREVLLRFAGTALLGRYRPALRTNISQTRGAPDLEVCVFDSASSDVALPSPPAPFRHAMARGQVSGFADAEQRAAFDVGGGLLQLFDPANSRALVWLRDLRQTSPHHRAAPLLQTLSWWLQKRGLVLAHGAAIGVNTEGALLAGRGGSGKSTTALNCLAAGFDYVSDDYCAVSQSAPNTWLAHHLYASGKVAPDNLHRVHPSLHARLEHIGLEKRVSFLEDSPGLVPSLRVRAVIVPRVGPGAARLEPLAGLKAVQALALSTVFQTLGDDAGRTAQLTRLCRSVPCMTLHLGDDPLAVPAVLRSWLEAL